MDVQRFPSRATAPRILPSLLDAIEVQGRNPADSRLVHVAPESVDVQMYPASVQFPCEAIASRVPSLLEAIE